LLPTKIKSIHNSISHTDWDAKQRARERPIYIFILELGTKTHKLIERRALNGPASKTPAFGENVIALGRGSD
jgi:hypothetical protein